MKELVWNLKDIFQDDHEFEESFEIVKQKVTHLKQYQESNWSATALWKLLEEYWDMKEKCNRILIYGSFGYYKDVQNPSMIEQKRRVEEFSSQIDCETDWIPKQIVEIGQDVITDWMLQLPKLEKYHLYFDNLFRMKNHLVKDPKTEHENQNRINQKITEYTNLIHHMEFPNIQVEGKEITLNTSNMNKYLNSRNRDVRKNAFLSINSSYHEKCQQYVEIMNEIYKKRIENAHLGNNTTVLESVLMKEKIDATVIENLIQTIQKSLPLLQKYMSLKMQYLEIEDPHLYDVGVPLDNKNQHKYSLEDAISMIRQALKPVGKEYLQIVDRLLDGHIDATLDPKKHQSITFSWNSYSFLNYKESYVDVKNLIHELGHIVNYELSHQNQPYLYEDSTIFVGEIASISNEIFLNRYLYQNAKTKGEKIFYLSKEIENYVTSVFRQTMYTEFEMELYKMATTDSLTTTKVITLYSQLQQKYYGKDISYDEEAKYEWMRFGHLFRWSYYPYKYATGLMMAGILVNGILTGTISIKQYIHFLSSGSSKYSLDLLKDLNMDILDISVMEKGLQILKDDVEEFEKLVK